jgi:soluble lytic murein transglycosylase-like protein
LGTARTPAQLAQVLTIAETAVRNPAVTGRALVQAAHTQQLVYRRLARSPSLGKAVVRRLPSPLRPAARANLRAGAALSSLVTPQPKLPDWRIVAPAPARRLLRHYHAAADRFGLQWQYLAAINLVETRMGRIRGKSTAGAQGPMQFMPATWDAYGRGDINDPADAIEAAARYLAASGGAQDIRGALWHYNHSDSYVDAVSAYAGVMRDHPQAYRGYYHWQVYYRTRKGDLLLPVGYGR